MLASKMGYEMVVTSGIGMVDKLVIYMVAL